MAIRTDSNPSAATSPTSAKAFKFWSYFTFGIFLFTLSLLTFSAFNFKSLTPPQNDHKSWFLSLPTELRHHYSKGRKYTVRRSPWDEFPFQVFAIEDGPRKGAESVLLIHGFGCNSYSFRNVIKSLASNGIRAVGIDLPGSGFSDKSGLVVEYYRLRKIFGSRLCDFYNKIQEKGLLWGFDQLVQNGGIPYYYAEAIEVPTTTSIQLLNLDSEEMGIVVRQVINALDLAPVHLVLHDSALEMFFHWVGENLEMVRSVTLIDSTQASTALPLRALEMPVVRDVVLGSSFVYWGLLRFFCSKSVNWTVAEAHRVLLRGGDGRRAVVGIEQGMKVRYSFDYGRYSFDLREWAAFIGAQSLPIQLLWSRNWSEEWTEEGRWVAGKFPQANFTKHSGTRWPQEDAADEIAETITNFVASLPKSVKSVEVLPISEHIQKMFDEAERCSYVDRPNLGEA